jgi:hypothetical protein
VGLLYSFLVLFASGLAAHSAAFSARSFTFNALAVSRATRFSAAIFSLYSFAAALSSLLSAF